MKLLLDTHALLWIVNEDKRLSPRVRTELANFDNDVYVASPPCGEATIKIAKGKLEVPGNHVNSIVGELETFRLSLLPISFKHLEALQALPTFHRDPFDRLLIAQSQAENMPHLTIDNRIRQYNVATIWN